MPALLVETAASSGVSKRESAHSRLHDEEEDRGGRRNERDGSCEERPYLKTASLIVNVRSLKSGLPMIIAMIGMIRSLTNGRDERCEREAHDEGHRELDEVPAEKEVPELP
jgi:hypothetical protein